MVIYIATEHVAIRPGPDAEKNVVIGYGGKRNQFAALNHSRQIHVVLTRLQIEFSNFGNLSSQKPMPILVVAELWRNLDGASASIFLNFFQGAGPQIRIGAAKSRCVSEIAGLAKGETF